ncbi:uncharacterized protein [Pleurodeles waltl]|uniref:uncharacterized protein isoform X1 n=1 Tax=Pleurodeles waltl TaxID=8319 RepID=UPI003709BF33
MSASDPSKETPQSFNPGYSPVDGAGPMHGANAKYGSPPYNATYGSPPYNATYGSPPYNPGYPYGNSAVVTTQPMVIVAPARAYETDYLGYSIFTMLCCCLPIGIGALIYSIKVHDTLPQVSEAPGHLIDPGSWVLVKNFQRTKNDQPRWTSPYLVLLSTRSAVRVEGKKNWIHGVHCKRVPFPLPYDRWDQEGIAHSETETVPRFLPFSDACVKGTISEQESDNNLQEAVPPSIRLNTTEPELLF